MVGSKQRYKAYPEYKDSGVEWLGKIPPHWQIWKLNHFSPIITCGVASTPEYVDDGVVFLSAQNVKNRKVDLTKGHKFISRKSHEELTKHRTPRKGDILLSRVGTVGEACVIDVDFDFSIFVSLTHLRLNNEICVNDFFIYLCASRYMESLHQAVTLVGGGVGNLNVNDFREYQLPIPPVREQLDIIKFLYYETAKIDTLIEKQQRLIELLIEKRQAVISHAVTKGLNSDVPMKDSGVEWLGEVPEHWEVSKFSYVKKVLTDYTANGSFADLKSNVNYLDEPSYARLVRLTDLRVNLENTNGVWINKKSYDYLSKSALYGGEFLLANVGAHAGLFYQMPYGKGRASLAPNMFMAKFDDKKVSREFMAFIGQSQGINEQLKLSATASSAQPKLNKDDFKAVKFAFPSLSEQAELVEYLNRKLPSFDRLINKAQQAVQLMQERRTALISAAVTGKIDVRDWVNPE